MSGGEPSSIKRKPSCAAELPILSPNRRKAAERTLSNCPCAVLWGAEQISLETTLLSERMHRACARIHPNGTKVPTNETFAPTGIKTHAHIAGFYGLDCALGAQERTLGGGLAPASFVVYEMSARAEERRGVHCIRRCTVNGGRRHLRT